MVSSKSNILDLQVFINEERISAPVDTFVSNLKNPFNLTTILSCSSNGGKGILNGRMFSRLTCWTVEPVALLIKRFLESGANSAYARYSELQNSFNGFIKTVRCPRHTFSCRTTAALPAGASRAYIISPLVGTARAFRKLYIFSETR